MRNKSFTLIELLIIIAIIGILSAILIPGYGALQRQLALQRSATKLAQDIRRAQEMAMAAKEYPRKGYGVYLDKTWEKGEKYYLYADTSTPNERYNIGDRILEGIELEKGIYISHINTPNGTVSINFTPPEPIVEISEGGITLDVAAITLCIRGTGCYGAKNIEVIRVNKVGLINVD